eukprot:7302928-Prymnesium_polylepis.3
MPPSPAKSTGIPGCGWRTMPLFLSFPKAACAYFDRGPTTGKPSRPRMLLKHASKCSAWYVMRDSHPSSIAMATRLAASSIVQS